jgi:tetratricopeptide (TPR) repeat protein
MEQAADTFADWIANFMDIHARAGIEPEHLHTLYTYACQSAERGDLKKADQLLYMLLLLDANNFDYALSLGLCRQKQGLHKEALFYFLRASSIRKADPRPFYHAARSYQKLGDASGARYALTWIIEHPVDVEACAQTDEPSDWYLAQCEALRDEAKQLLAQLPT